MNPWISIIIPSRNDAAALCRTLDDLGRLTGIDQAEVIVAAGRDSEGTERAVAGRVVHQFNACGALNAGARVARGNALFFVHADSLPPPNGLDLIHEALAEPRVVGGAFEHVFAEPSVSLRLITCINRYRLTGNYYGDQGIFVRAPVFREQGGYKDLSLMEDLDFTQRLKRRGRSVLVREPMLTSGGRFLARGPWRTFFFIVGLLAVHTLGFDTQRFAERWRGPADRMPGMPGPRGARS